DVPLRVKFGWKETGWWFRFDGVEENDARGGAVGRICEVPQGERGDGAWEANCAGRAGSSCRADGEGWFREAFPGPVTVEVEFERGDPVIEEFGLIGECDGRIVGRESVAECLGAGEDGAGAGFSCKDEIVGFEIECLREKLNLTL